jgi:hypothetical protein
MVRDLNSHRRAIAAPSRCHNAPERLFRLDDERRKRCSFEARDDNLAAGSWKHSEELIASATAT